MNQKPIGIFDSGIGGLTVARAISQQMPGESILYFGDTRHLPYGDKSPAAITEYARNITRFLVDSGCKIIISACNSASSVAYDSLVQEFGSRVPIVNVIDPIVKEVVRESVNRTIGVIGTKATIRANEYEKRILTLDNTRNVVSVPTPLLAPMIEEGFYNNTLSEAILQAYLNFPDFKQIDALILACTHYPLLRPQIERFFNGKVRIYDSTGIIAREVELILEKNSLLNHNGKTHHRFYVSDYTESFEKTTQIFYGNKIHLEQIDIHKGE